MSEADTIRVEIAVIGGGIAGASAAAHLAGEGPLVLLEREDQPGYHTSGRSAALFSETYGNAVVRALSVASRSFLEAPPEGFAEHPVLTPRGALHAGTADDEAELDALYRDAHGLVPSVRRLGAAEVLSLCPVLRPDWAVGGVLEPDARDIDTHGLLSGYLRLLRHRGGRIATGFEVDRIERGGAGWRIGSRDRVVEARTVVNAAGAWADAVARLAGLSPAGIVPKRRTAFLFEPPPDVPHRAWPLVVSAREDFYFKPDAGMILGSLADETPSEPTDAQPEEIDIATAVDRIETATDLRIRRISRAWAGLRCFARDKTPVVGFDPEVDGFLWLAGQGGYGFQTAPALAWCAASLVRTGSLPPGIEDMGVTADALSPERFRSSTRRG